MCLYFNSKLYRLDFIKNIYVYIRFMHIHVYMHIYVCVYKHTCNRNTHL